MLSIINRANKTVTFAVKISKGLTEERTIRNKIMKEDVLSSLMSSNFVDTNIGNIAVISGNTYLYKNKVEIPPLMMQDDTLSVNVCGCGCMWTKRQPLDKMR